METTETLDLAERWRQADEWRTSLACEMARTGTLDPSALELRMLAVENHLGLVAHGRIDELPLLIRVVAEAVLADIRLHQVLFARYADDPSRYRAVFALAARFPTDFSLFSRGENVCLARRQAGP